MALPIKAIPTLYGEEARRFRLLADDAEKNYAERGPKNLSNDPRYLAMKTILAKSGMV
ncbi:MAG: hypothetical protein HUK21_02195 [Fibrobacteraceae bacterium]|nr:hypothetical protein [Fibrobacteraceae bacterium]